MTQSTDPAGDTAGAAGAEPPQHALAERLAQPLGLNFSALANAIRDSEHLKTIPDGVRELLDAAARSLHAEVCPDVDERQSALVLLTASVITAMLAEDADGGWTALSIVNVLASMGLRLWRLAPDIGKPPVFFKSGVTYINGTVYQPPEVAIVFRCVAVAAHPRASEGPIAFGFAARAYPGDNWTHFLANRDEWDQGWRVFRGLALPSVEPAADSGETTIEPAAQDPQPPADGQPDTDPPVTIRARLAHSLGLGLGQRADQDAQEDADA